MKPKDITFSQDLLHELFEYKDGQLYRNGKLAGGLHKSGYRQIKLNNKQYPAHRLVWVYHHGYIDTQYQIDHIDGNKDNNAIDNLRLVTARENCYNRSKLKAKGYSWDKNNKRWHASIAIENALKYLGQFKYKTDARLAYVTAASQYHNIQGHKV